MHAPPGRGVRRQDEAGQEVTAVRTTGLVVGTDDPLDNKLRLGNKYRGWVRVIADAGGSQLNALGRFDLTEDRWLVVGMEIPVEIDPENPGNFEIDWDAIPSMEERAAANDPTLADPISAQQRAREGLFGASGAAAGPGHLAPEQLKQAMEYAASQPAPAGKKRAIVIVAAITATRRAGETGGRLDAGPKRVSTGKRKAVLSVNVPGQAPYALFQNKFKRPRGFAGSGVPALVSSNDPGDVECLWKELRR